jgi:hypothetical protein
MRATPLLDERLTLEDDAFVELVDFWADVARAKE